MANHIAQCILLILSGVITLHHVNSQNCVPAQKGLDITEQAYRSPIVIRARVTKQGKVNHEAQVTAIFPTRNGGLKEMSNITFGPAKKGKGCTRIKKNSEYLLLLEEESTTVKNFHSIKFDPVSKLSLAKKLKKLLCKGCVKPPSFSGKNKDSKIKENGKFTFNCKVKGYRKPMAVFLKDGEIMKKTKGMKIKIKKKGGGGRLKISKVKLEHAGVYTCQATNIAGTANLTYSFTVWKDDCMECPKERQGYCVHGRCCIVPVVNQTACRCDPKYQGKRCDEKKVPLLPRNKINLIEARYHQQTIAIMAVCIALLLVVFICYVVYCKFKKSRSILRKQIIAKNGHVGIRPIENAPDRAIANTTASGVLGDDSDNRDIQMTGYRSTNLTELPPHPHPTSFSQRPQTYDDVILTASGAAEAQPLMHRDNEHAAYRSKRDEARQARDVNGRRRRKKGVAIGLPGDHSRSTSDMEAPKGSRRVDELKSGQNSMSSSASSLASHELRKPALPIDEKLASLAKSGVIRPPAYPNGHQEDFPDSGHQPFHFPQNIEIAQESLNPSSVHSQRAGSTSSPTSPVSREHAPSTTSSGSTHRVTTFDADGRIEEETLGRDEGPLQSVVPHSPSLSPDSFHQHVPRFDQIPAAMSPTSPGSNFSSHQMSPRGKLPYQSRDVGANVYPYYEHNPDHPRSLSSSHHDSDDIFSGMDAPDTSPYMYDNQRRSQPSSPRLYPAGPEMGVPYRHAPVTVASARTHHLPLLTKERSELAPIDQTENRLMAGSTVSLSSSSSGRSSQDTEKNRNSHKIEV